MRADFLGSTAGSTDGLAVAWFLSGLEPEPLKILSIDSRPYSTRYSTRDPGQSGFLRECLAVELETVSDADNDA